MHNVTIAKIQARCAAYNKAHKLLMSAAPSIREWVKTLIGQKIYKADGTLLEKFNKTKPKIEGVYIDCGTYTIRAEARHVSVQQEYVNHRGERDTVNETGGHSMYFCDVKDGVAVDNPRYHDADHTIMRTDYNSEEEIKAIEMCERIEETLLAAAHGHHAIFSVTVRINTP